MANEGEQRVLCPECGKGYRWNREMAGGTVACKQCGTGFTIPNVPGRGIKQKPQPAPEPETDPGDSVYELAFDEDHPESPDASPTTTRKCPSCSTEVKPDAVICLKCGYNLEERSRVQTSVKTHSPPPTPPASATTAPAAVGVGDDEPVEEPAQVSEAVKQQRREEQRKAAAELEKDTNKLKLPLILGGLVALLAIIFVVILAVSDGLDGILKQ